MRSIKEFKIILFFLWGVCFLIYTFGSKGFSEYSFKQSSLKDIAKAEDSNVHYSIDKERSDNREILNGYRSVQPINARVTNANASFDYFSDLGFVYGDQFLMQVDFYGTNAVETAIVHCILEKAGRRFGSTGDGPFDFLVECRPTKIPPVLDGIFLFTVNFGSAPSEFLGKYREKSTDKFELYPVKVVDFPEEFLMEDSKNGLRFGAGFLPAPGERTGRFFSQNPVASALEVQRVTVSIEEID